MSKSSGMLLILSLAVSLLLSTGLLTDVSSQTSSSEPVSAPAIEWQQQYHNYSVLIDGNPTSLSNLIQTSDGGFAFLSLGYPRQGQLHPARLFKTDSTGNIQWTKEFDSFTASTIIQTSDGGYEISGNWRLQVYNLEPTLIKTDAYGNIQWSQNYSSVPNFSVNSTMIQTSDGGFACVRGGDIVKTDSRNQTLWEKNIIVNRTRTVFEIEHNWTVIDYPVYLDSLIETSDGSLAVVGVAFTYGNPYNSYACLIKTEAFLPLPYQTPLPTPITTPSPEPSLKVTIVILAILVVIAVAVLLLILKKRKGKD